MGELKIHLPEELVKEFKKRSMEAFGYGKGSISKAGEEAIRRWTSEREGLSREWSTPPQSIRQFRGILKHVKMSSVELQHEASRTRSSRARI